jgi:hypothetical protein
MGILEGEILEELRAIRAAIEKVMTMPAWAMVEQPRRHPIYQDPEAPELRMPDVPMMPSSPRIPSEGLPVCKTCLVYLPVGQDQWRCFNPHNGIGCEAPDVLAAAGYPVEWEFDREDSCTIWTITGDRKACKHGQWSTLGCYACAQEALPPSAA